MSHKAKDHFTDWYVSGVKKDVSPDEYSKRRRGIEEILENDDIYFWIEVIEIYFGDYEPSDEVYQEHINIFKNYDEQFSLKNDFVFRLLLGCALAEKIEQKNDALSNFIALAIISRMRFITAATLEDLVKIAENLILKNAFKSRREIFNAAPKEVDTSDLNILIADTSDDNSDEETESLNTELAEKHNELLSIINELSHQNQLFYRKNQALAEESEILWWLFTGYSEIANNLVKKISLQDLAVIGPIELAKLTNILPGLTNPRGFLLAVYDKAGHDPLIETSLANIITGTALHREKILRNLPPQESELEKYCVLTAGVRHFLTYSETEWQSVFNKTNKVNLTTAVSAISFSMQLYQELMLAKLFKALTKDGN